MTRTADAMRRKRAADKAAGRSAVTTPLPNEIIAEIDAEKNTRRLMTRGDAIAVVWQEWKQLKAAQEQATP